MPTIRSVKLDGEIARDNPEISRESHDAPATIATHHSSTSVRIVKDHPEIPLVTFLQQHHSVGSEASMTVAQMADLIRGKAQITITIVGQEKVVARSVIFEKLL